MEIAENGAAALDALSDEDYNRRVAETIDMIMDRIEDAIRSDDPIEAELLYVAAPAAVRNILAVLVAEECLDQPRPFRLVKERVRELDLEATALAMLKTLQAEEGTKADEA